MSSRSNAASPSPPHASGAEKTAPKATNTNGANYTNIAIGLLYALVIASFALQYAMATYQAQISTDILTFSTNSFKYSVELLKSLSAMPDFLEAEALGT
jgi:hypothetical protein